MAKLQMFIITRRVRVIVTVALISSCGLAVGEKVAPFGFGRVPSVPELEKFTSPLPDGRGLPEGSGTVEQGRIIYLEQCASCHGQHLEGGIGDRLIGGRGTLVNSDPAKSPIRTVESYWPYATTLFDYIKRAMPLTAPSSLTNNQVYAVSAYILSEGKIVPPDTVLNEVNLAKIKMPNRYGFIPDPRPEKFPSVKNLHHQLQPIAVTNK
jgi:cytochrome c